METIKEKTQKVRVSFSRLIIFIFVIVILTRMFVGFLIGRPKIELVKYGVLDINEVADGYIIRNETILRASDSGKLDILVPEGVFVKKGAVIARLNKSTGINESGKTAAAQLNSAKYDITSSEPGIVSYKFDGYEQFLSSKDISSITTDKLLSTPGGSINNNLNDVQYGQPIVKIIDNFAWYIAIPLKTEKLEPLKLNDNIFVKVGDSDKLPAKVYMIKNEDKGNSILVLQLTTLQEKYYNMRKVPVNIVKRSYEGIKIPVTSLVTRGNKRGVIIVDKGITKFKEIDILGFDDKYAISEVENELSAGKGLSMYDEIILNPLKVPEGNLVR